MKRTISFFSRFLPILYIVTKVCAVPNGFIGIERFTISSPAISYYQSIDVLLFQRLNFELLPDGIKPVVISDTVPKECIAIAGGTIDFVDSVPVLVFKISGTGSTEKDQETKRIALNQPIDAIVDILTLKIRHFLEQNIAGKLRISSYPLDCEVFLNGLKIGSTPAELFLDQGRYGIELRRLYFAPFKDSISILPGRENVIKPTMIFRGNNTRPWIVSALIFSVGTITAQILELHYHDEYMVTRTSGEFNAAYARYEAMNITKVCISIPAVVSWIITVHHAYGNKTLKKGIFGEKS